MILGITDVLFGKTSHPGSTNASLTELVYTLEYLYCLDWAGQLGSATMLDVNSMQLVRISTIIIHIKYKIF